MGGHGAPAGRLVGLGRALDIILTAARGTPVGAAIGLANRVVPPVARAPKPRRSPANIAASPPYSVRSDRRSACESVGLRLPAALRREYTLGAASFNTGEQHRRRQKFASGAGRHGKF